MEQQETAADFHEVKVNAFFIKLQRNRLQIGFVQGVVLKEMTHGTDFHSNFI